MIISSRWRSYHFHISSSSSIAILYFHQELRRIAGYRAGVQSTMTFDAADVSFFSFFSRFNDFRCKNKIFIMDWHLKIETAREWKEGQMKKKKMIVNIVSFFFSWISVGGTRWINNNNKWDKSVVKYELLLRCRVRLHVTYDAGWVVGSREFEHRNHSPSLRQQFIYPYHFHKFAHINAQPLVYSTFNYTFCRLHPLRALGAAHTTQVCNWSWLNGGKFKFLTLMALSDGKYNR